ncbi:MAG: hypothetical protein EBU96_12595, partial [Actinobacteria bacterium]|nr:hypothetical protein [Actinomycetota bacterium]
PLDQPSNSALYVQGPVLGSQTGAAIGSGYVGEVKSSVISTWTNLPGSAQYFDAANITLTPGVWLVTAKLMFLRNSATFSGTYVSDAIVGFSTTTGNSGTGLVEGYSSVDASNYIPVLFGAIPITTASSLIRCDSSNCYVAGNTLTGTTLYLKGYLSIYTAGTPQYKGAIEAIRLN